MPYPHKMLQQLHPVFFCCHPKPQRCYRFNLAGKEGIGKIAANLFNSQVVVKQHDKAKTKEKSMKKKKQNVTNKSRQ